MLDIVGNQKVIFFLKKEAEKKTFSQSYLFFGPRHLGKFSVALSFAQEIVENGEKNNADIIIISPKEEEKNGVMRIKDIGVDEIRQLQHWASLYSSGRGCKVGIIDDAEKMTVSAQNAFLKTLEEPPLNCVFILVCHNKEKILLTVVSRCVKRKFNLVNDMEIRKIAGIAGNSEVLSFGALGRPGMAIKIKKGEVIFEYNRIKEELEKIIKNNLNENFIWAEKNFKMINDLSIKMNFWLALLRENMFEKEILKGISSSQSFFIIEELEKFLQNAKKYNSNIRLVLENILFSFIKIIN